MDKVLLIILVFSGISLVGLVLLQQGKGADAGAAFGSGASATVFGSRGSASFLTRTTGVLATIFFMTCLILAYFTDKGSAPVSVLEKTQQSQKTMDSPMVPVNEEKMDEIPLAPIQTENEGKISTDIPDLPVQHDNTTAAPDSHTGGDKPMSQHKEKLDSKIKDTPDL